MPNDVRGHLFRLIEEHGARLFRYCGVSVVNVLTGIGTLWICLEVLEINRVSANVIAWAVSTIPAYLLSRYWVWQQSGASSVRREIAPFWILAFIGLAFSTAAIWVAGFFTDRSILLILVNFCAYGIVWVAKYLVLDRFMWNSPSSPVVTEVV